MNQLQTSALTFRVGHLSRDLSSSSNSRWHHGCKNPWWSLTGWRRSIPRKLWPSNLLARARRNRPWAQPISITSGRELSPKTLLQSGGCWGCWYWDFRGFTCCRTRTPAACARFQSPLPGERVSGSPMCGKQIFIANRLMTATILWSCQAGKRISKRKLQAETIWNKRTPSLLYCSLERENLFPYQRICFQFQPSFKKDILWVSVLLSWVGSIPICRAPSDQVLARVLRNFWCQVRLLASHIDHLWNLWQDVDFWFAQ